MIYEYIEELRRVLPVIDVNADDPPPSEAECLEAERLEAAVAAGDPRVRLVRSPHAVRVLWLG